MSGPIALHGGGEFLPGDERFLRAILEAARPAARARAIACGRTTSTEREPIRVVVVPVAAAHHAEAVAHQGLEALEAVARAGDLPVRIDAALIVDAETAADATLATRLAAADLVHLPGGEPARVPRILTDTLAWRSIIAANARGAVVAGASAGAMGLADTTWTPDGWRAGLGLVHGLVVAPHFESFDIRGREADIERLDREGTGRLGLDERTGVIREADGRWRVAGAGRAHWYAPGSAPITGADGDTLPIAG